MRLLGLDLSRIVFVNKVTQYRRIIVPDAIMHPGKYVSPLYKEIINVVCCNAMQEVKNINKIDKIYLSRTQLKEKKEIGETNIEIIMKQCGYTILYPEELTLAEQIFYWQNASEISCINGTIPHMCVFATSKLSLYILNKMSNIVGYQFTMDQVWGKTPIYISAYNEVCKRYPLTISRGPFWIRVRPELHDFIYNKYGIIIKQTFHYTEWIHYITLCASVEIKFQLRGKGYKLKSLLNKLLRLERSWKNGQQ